MLLVGLVVWLPCASAYADGGTSTPRRHLIVGINYDYPPYEYVNEAGEPTGYDVDLARAVLTSMGVDAEFRADAWTEVRKALEEGRIDLSAGMLYSPERDRVYDFSVPHTVVHYAIFVRRATTGIHAEADLHHRKVIVERGSAMHDYLLGHGFNSELVLVESEPSALRLLASGAHDCALAPTVYAGTPAFRELMAGLQTVGPPLQSRELAFAVREGNTEVLSVLNEGLGLIKSKGEYRAIQDRWFGVVETASPSRTAILRVVAIPLLLLLMIAGGALAWTWTLRRQVAQRTQELRSELAEREKAQAAVDYRLNRERFTARTSTKLASMTAAHLDSTVELILADLGEHLGADMASFFEVSESGTTLAGRSTWLREGSAVPGPPFAPKPLEVYPWLADEARAQRMLIVADIEELNEQAEVEKAQWRREGIVSMVVAPAFLDSELVGLLAVASLGKQHVWDEDDVQLVRTFCVSFAQSYARGRAEQASHAEKERLAVTLAAIGEGVIGCDGAGKIVLLNDSAETMLGRERGDCLGQAADEVIDLREERTWVRVGTDLPALLSGGREPRSLGELQLVHFEGREELVTYGESIVRGRDGRPIGAVLVLRDVTEERARVTQMQQAQKLESIGLLAGGIAHDFNNILTAILGNVSLALHLLHPGDEATELLVEAEKASVRAQGLTRQLLTFAKGGAPVRRVIQLGVTLREAPVFALRGSNVKVEFDIDPALRPTFADAGQIGQVIQNLAINAKQSMPSGGALTIRASNLVVDASNGLGLPAGEYVVVSVSDTGVGICPENLARIFDPYFTTKAEGSGLGLTTSYSIVKNHAGRMEVESEIGRGTTFRILLPAAAPGEAGDVERDAPVERGQGRILIMDDDEAVLNVVDQMLRRVGYEPACVRDGQAAIAAWIEARQAGKPFRAIIVDLTVPGGMGGKECVAALLAIDPGLKAIVSSGYSQDAVMADHLHYGFCGVVAKPYAIARLAAVLAEVLAK